MSEPNGSAAALQGPAPPSLPRAAGCMVIEEILPSLPASPGVYRMLNAGGDVLYVGKARNLRKRVANYVSAARLGPRLHRMVSETVAMEFVTTHSEAEALLLEANLIKQLKPRYNILLRDDKSFPAILVSADHPFPQVVKHRGAQSRAGTYFGPFASAWAVNKTLAALQRAFLLRTCSDAVFASRTRPCLLYQIKRCSAPCVGYIGADAYGELVAEAAAFLRGDSQRLQQDLARKMEQASAALSFEDAARYRDRIRAMASIQAHQDINLAGLGDADVVALVMDGGAACVQVFFFRGGCNYGNRAYFPDQTSGESEAAVLEAFLGQFYASRPPPPLVLVSHPPQNQDLLAEALAVRAGARVKLTVPQRGAKQKLVAHALDNAREALGRRLAERTSQLRLLEALARALVLEAPPARVEVYDNSHIAGSNAVGAMIVAGRDGFIRDAYRKFNIRTPAAPGDDYAMLREVLERRFARALKEDPERRAAQWPDLILIDGGAGQLSSALQILNDLGLGDLAVAAIAKGPERNAGRERIFRPGQPPISLPPKDPVLYFLQRLRDEAHRFAIGSHRARRAAGLTTSALDDIPGVGARRKRALLHHFGSSQAVARAGVADLAAVPGISQSFAKKIYDWFNPDR